MDKNDHRPHWVQDLHDALDFGSNIKPINQEKTKRPSIGIVPKKIHEASRLDEIRSAISRRYNNNEIIPTEWIEEYNELLKKLIIL